MAGKWLERRAFAETKSPCVILEIGGNHEGDVQYAEKLVSLACQTTAAVVKLQIYSADGLVNPRFDPGRHAHFRKFELQVEEYRALLTTIRAAGKKTCASVWSEELFAELKDSIDFIKVGSGDFNNSLLTDLFIQSGKPVIFSTGLATFEEVEVVLDRAKDLAGPRWPTEFALLQCTTSYPCPAEFTNLAVMETFRRRFDCAIGFSDHYQGTLAAEVAFDIGAQIFEFHFTDERDGKTFRDHSVSWTKDEVNAFVERCALVEQLYGDSDKVLTTIESEQRHDYQFRKGLYFSRALQTGARLQRSDLVGLRPAAAVSPFDYGELVGRRLLRDVEALQQVQRSDLAESE